METIGVFFGGKSPEHDISIITGQLILSGLREMGYSVIPVYINRKGDWLSHADLGSIDFFRDPRFEERLTRQQTWRFDLRASQGKIHLKKKGWPARSVVIDLAFPAFHGRNGEDGTIQGIFELMNIPYVGCGVASSAIAMDKVLTKLLYQRLGIPTTSFLYYSFSQWLENKGEIIQEIIAKLRWPLFVKPSRLGSSIGIERVENEQELGFALEVGFHYDTKVLVEEGVERLIDVTCAVLGNENPQVSLLQESVFEGKFFDYVAKYLKAGGAQFGKSQKSIYIPARLDEDTTRRIQDYAKQIFTSFECSGIARVDFLYDSAAKKVYANEVNTLPGILYHHLWEKSGITFKRLLSELIRLARERHRDNRQLITTFNSSVLTNTSSIKLSSKLRL